eukprot:6897894-Pyramimonas_sp.AAC.1
MGRVDRKVKIARAVKGVAAAVLPFFPRVEFLGLERVPPPPSSSTPQRGFNLWQWKSNFWRCAVCLRRVVSPDRPAGGAYRGHSRLDSVVLDRLQHR